MQRSFGGNNNNNNDDTNRPVSNGADLAAKEKELAKREGILEERERLIAEKLDDLEAKAKKADEARKELVEKLGKVSSISADAAKELLLTNVEKDLTAEISKRVKAAEEEIRIQSSEKAQQVLADAMYNGVADYISEYTTSTVKLADEEMKGRIIGKEGRNIKAFEQSTGVDVVMDDDLPNTLILSSFDSVRREVAKISLERLLADGRIQPQRIEEVVESTKKDIEKEVRDAWMKSKNGDSLVVGQEEDEDGEPGSLEEAD